SFGTIEENISTDENMLTNHRREIFLCITLGIMSITIINFLEDNQYPAWQGRIVYVSATR
ncbi:hypothetical protein OFC53_32040, partial [Escherichia coli]|nr:hypothetical protein [Escherichia coli]